MKSASTNYSHWQLLAYKIYSNNTIQPLLGLLPAVGTLIVPTELTGVKE